MHKNLFYIKQIKPIPLLFLVCVFFPIQTVAAASSYDALIIEARRGNSTPLLNYLENQENKNTLSPNKIADWLQVSSWGSDNDEVTIDIWQRYHGRMNLPTRGKIAAARAYHNQKNWNNSLAVWEQVLLEEPNNADAHIGWIMTLADARYYQRALIEANNWAQRYPGADVETLRAYVYSSQGKHWDALFAASRAVEIDPNNKRAKAVLLSALSANRVSKPAQELAEDVPTSDPVKRSLALNSTATKVRASYTPARNEAERFVVADKALAHYAQLLAAWKDEPSAQNDIRRARIDRMGALLIRKRTVEVIQEYESLSKDSTVPNYAKRWVASALLSEHQPEKAKVMLMDIYYPNGPIPATPLTYEERQDLFYA